MWDPDSDHYTTLCTFLTLDDIAKVSQTAIDQDTPVLQAKAIAKQKKSGYKLVCLPLTTKKWKERWSGMCLLPVNTNEEDKEIAARQAEEWRLNPGFRMDEVTITRLDEAADISIMVSEWLELDATEDGVRHDAEIALQQELSYASYLNIQTAILPPPRHRDHVASYARIVNSCLQKLPMISLSVRLPIYNPSAFQQPGSPIPAFHPPLSSPMSPEGGPLSVLISESGSISNPPGEDLNATWEMWDVIRSVCDYNRRLTLTLDLSPALPTTLGVLSKWAAESVAHIFLPSSTFIANKKGYPVLPKPTQQFIRDSIMASLLVLQHDIDDIDGRLLWQHRPVIILADVSAGNHTQGGEEVYAQYVRHLEKTSPIVQAAQKPGTVEYFAQGYQDYLQAPLQPLMDNLASITYQTFEQDPVKYMLYEEAMYRAFIDRPSNQKSVVCIAGAGRGPLVARCLRALERSRHNAMIYAVEKNPNAFVTLQHRKTTEWGNRVELVFGDVRAIDVPEKADVLVSELLGSFGDNELSPECLDGAMRFLKPTGISIPSSYTAHLAPLSSSKLYNEARTSSNEKSLETPYVVMFQLVNILSGTKAGGDGRCGPQIQECWEFEHPRRDAVLNSRGLPYTNSHNTRSAKLRFYIPHAGILHGLAGYFEAVLYGSVGLSIHPQRKEEVSKDMLSWFPLFFPFKEPLYLPSNSELQVSIWRLTNERQVWYEWHAESFICIPNTARASEELLLGQPSLNNSSSFSSLAVPSPLVDGDTPFINTDRFVSNASGRHNNSDYETVKIGHTSLHNPGGRSSWIGL